MDCLFFPQLSIINEAATKCLSVCLSFPVNFKQITYAACISKPHKTVINTLCNYGRKKLQRYQGQIKGNVLEITPKRKRGLERSADKRSSDRTLPR